VNLPQQRPNYKNDKTEKVIQMSYLQVSEEKLPKPASNCFQILFYFDFKIIKLTSRFFHRY